MMRTLVVYYSRTGHTKHVAKELAIALNADLEEIVDRTSRMGLLGYLRSGYEATFEKSADIQPPRLQPASYDLVLVGTPVWSSALSSPVRTYLSRMGERIPCLGIFCTEGGRGGANALRQMALLAKQPPVAELVLRDRELDEGTATPKILAFAHGLMRPGVVPSTMPPAPPPSQSSLRSARPAANLQ